MILICFGTRPELIKLIPLIHTFQKHNVCFQTLFTGQHETLIRDFYEYIDTPTYTFEQIMKHGQSLNCLASNLLLKMDQLLKTHSFSKIIIQGDTTSAFTIAMSAYHNHIQVVHIEAGLRTDHKHNPFPEEMNRRLISQIADYHFCPTQISYDNLCNENITNNVHMVGNTVVDMYTYMKQKNTPHQELHSTISNLIETQTNYIIVTLHRRENRGDSVQDMWNQLNHLSQTHHFVYIYHPSLPNSKIMLNEHITILDPLNYKNMVQLIIHCCGIISDSGGLQEEAVCANKKILVCRETTERPETITCGLGKLINTDITNNIAFLNTNIDDTTIENPYGKNVCEQIHTIITK